MSATCDVCMYNIYYNEKRALCSQVGFSHKGIVSFIFFSEWTAFKTLSFTHLKSTQCTRSSSSKRMCCSPVQLDLILSLCSCTFIIWLYNILLYVDRMCWFACQRRGRWNHWRSSTQSCWMRMDAWGYSLSTQGRLLQVNWWRKTLSLNQLLVCMNDWVSICHCCGFLNDNKNGNL